MPDQLNAKTTLDANLHFLSAENTYIHIYIYVALQILCIQYIHF